MDNPIFNEIKNWRLFTEKFGEEYTMHDASIKRFNLNEDELTVVLNTIYTVNDDDKVYDVTFKFTNLVRINTELEIGNDYAWGVEVEKDKYFRNLFRFTIESAYAVIECFDIELVSITEAEPFERGMICLDDPDTKPENSKRIWRS